MTEDERIAAIAAFMGQDGPVSEAAWMAFEAALLAEAGDDI